MGEGPHDSLSRAGWKGSGRGVRPPSRKRLTPQGRDRQAAPAQPPESSTGGPQRDRGEPTRPPPSPLSTPQPTDSRRPARGTAAQHPPRRARGDPPPPLRGPRHPERGATRPVRRAPPVSRPRTPTVTAAGQQPCAGAQGQPADRIRAVARVPQLVQYGGHALRGQGKARAARPDARLGGGGRGTDRGGATIRPPHPWAPRSSPRRGAAHQPHSSHQTDPQADSQTAPGARGWQTALTEHAAPSDARRRAAGHEGGPGLGAAGHPPRSRRGSGPGIQRGVARNHGTTPPPFPPPPPSGSRDTGGGQRGRRPSTPPKSRGGPPHQRATAGGRGTPLGPYGTRPHAATRLLQQ